jgi:hypothetical protein
VRVAVAELVRAAKIAAGAGDAEDETVPRGEDVLISNLLIESKGMGGVGSRWDVEVTVAALVRAAKVARRATDTKNETVAGGEDGLIRNQCTGAGGWGVAELVRATKSAAGARDAENQTVARGEK